MSEHTPGPWQVEAGGFVGGPVGSGRICQFWNNFQEDFKNHEANARLIAAAPDLLAAAQRKLADCRETGECDDAALLPGEVCSDECAALAQAIEKATGKPA